MDGLSQGLLNKLDRKTVTMWAADCAERVLPLFERKYTQDKRPRKTIAAGRAWARGQLAFREARAAALAAHAAARRAKDDAARSAARAAGHAAATAHAAGHAIAAAAYAAQVVGYQASAKERDWQDRRLRRLRQS